MLPLLSIACAMLAKLQVGEVKEFELAESHDSTPEKSAEKLTMFPVTDKPYDAEGYSDDNEFSKWSPSGNFELMITNPNLFDKFKVGEKYYVSFHKELPDVSGPVAEDKALRVAVDNVIQHLKGCERKSRERSLALTKLQEAVMWLGMDLKDIGDTPNPYPHSKDPTSPIIDATADGLKL